MMQGGDLDEVVLEAEVTNLGALSLYTHLGFIRDKRLARHALLRIHLLLWSNHAACLLPTVSQSSAQAWHALHCMAGFTMHRVIACEHRTTSCAAWKIC